MKSLVVALVGISLFVEAFSITCYRCGGAVASCETSSPRTVECTDSSIPNAVFACQIYSVNYTTRGGQVLQFKGCCLYEECNKNPCDEFGHGTVCTEMASCQSNECNKDYATALASQRPTQPSKAHKAFFDCLVLALAAMACSCYFIM